MAHAKNTVPPCSVVRGQRTGLAIPTHFTATPAAWFSYLPSEAVTPERLPSRRRRKDAAGWPAHRYACGLVVEAAGLFVVADGA